MDLRWPDYESLDDALDDHPGFYVRMPFVFLYNFYKSLSDCFRNSSFL